MKTLAVVLAVAILASVTGIALCQDAGGGRPSMVMGTLVKVDGKNLVVKQMARGAEAKEVTVATDDKTTFVVDAEPGKLADLKAEMRVMITPDTGTAVKVSATSKGLSGQIVKVDGKNVIVNVRAPGGGEAKETTVVTDEKTKIFIGEKAGKLEDLKADMRVTVLPETGTAAKIIATVGGRGGRAGGARPGGGAGGGGAAN